MPIPSACSNEIPKSDQPIVIGIIGGIASGKSLVSKLLVEHFAELGATVIDADEVAHQQLLDPEVIHSIRLAFGESVIDDQGRIDRSQLAKVVFHPGDRNHGHRKELEAILHPRIRQVIEKRLDDIRRAGWPRVVILDVPLLLEVGWRELCDRVLFVDASETTRRQRALDRHWTASQWKDREASQMPVEEKRRAADWIVKNDGPLDQLQAQLEELWQRIKQSML